MATNTSNPAKRTRTYKLAPIHPDAVLITRQQAAAVYGGGSVQQIDKWLAIEPQIRRIRVPGRGKTARHVLIYRADLERYAQKFLVAGVRP